MRDRWEDTNNYSQHRLNYPAKCQQIKNYTLANNYKFCVVYFIEIGNIRYVLPKIIWQWM